MNLIGSTFVNKGLIDHEDGCSECMIGEEYIVEVNLSGLILIEEIALCIIDRIEEEPSKIKFHEIKIHSLHTTITKPLLL